MSEKLEQLKALQAEIFDLNVAQAVLGWDQQTYMPPGGAEARGNALATLGKIAHQKATSDEMGRLLEDLKKETAGLDPDADEARLIKVSWKDYQDATRIPSDFVAEFALASTRGHEAWVEAKGKSDFSIFRPYLEKLLDLGKRLVTFFPPADHPYDVLLDRFEPGMKTADVKAIFEALRPQQVELIREIAARPQVDDSFLYLPFDEQKQWDFGVEVITKFGYDWNRGRQDKAAHPFSTSFGIDDVRITTRLEELAVAAFYSTAHEAGHALYEMGVSPAYDRSALAGGASMAIHESQSRMWENMIGRSLPFWEHFYPKFQALFPAQLGNVDLQKFHKAVNKVEPSFIRVNADEATYNLHIMLRLEIEIGLIEGVLEVKDLPEIWNTKFKEYLGIVPPDDAQGVLQDVHWSSGLMGYFPTYALGNLVSAQLWEKINQEIPDLDDQTRAGKFEALLDWLKRNVHTHGRKYETQELVQKVTGAKIDPDPYMRYLRSKLGPVYGL